MPRWQLADQRRRFGSDLANFGPGLEDCGGVGPVGPQAPEHAARAARGRMGAVEGGKELAEPELTAARQLGVAAIDLDADERQVKRVDLAIEFDCVAAIALAESDRCQIRAVVVRDRVTDHLVTQHRLNGDLFVALRSINPANGISRRHNIDRTSNTHVPNSLLGNSSCSPDPGC